MKYHKCSLNPDQHKECSCLIKRHGVFICDVYDEKRKNLKKCPLK